MGNYQISKKQILTVAVLIILTAGLFVSVYLVQKQQIFKSKASQDVFNAFEVSPADQQKQVGCSEGTCQTDTLDIQIKLKDIEALTK